MSQTGSSRIESIQMLRAAAALAVALGHAQHEALALPAAASGFHPLLLNVSGAGVDLFFVISGFVMVHASRGLFAAPDGARIFLARRAARIVPLYWATTSLFLAILFLAPSALSSAPPNAVEIVKSYLFIPYAGDATGLIQPVYKLGWTLNYEMFFYALFACALILPPRAAAIAAIGLLGALAAFGAWLRPASGAAAFWTDAIILEFAAGVAIASLRGEGIRLRRAAAAGFAAAAAAGLAIAAWADPDISGFSRLLWWGVPAALIVAGAALSEPPARPSAGAVAAMLIALGNASYALYLLHPIAIRALRVLWDRSGASVAADPRLFVAAALALSIIAALLVFRWFERPATHFLQATLGAGPRSRARVDPRPAAT